jgi:hypothetical protein
MRMGDQPTYDEEVKRLSRQKALSRAVRLVTRDRDRAAVVSADHVRRARKSTRRSDSTYDRDAAGRLHRNDVVKWERFRRQCIGRRKASEITVAYLAGPQPTNDLLELIRLGVRPENIWAFENKAALAEAGAKDIKRLATRGVKFVHVGIEDFLIATSRRFDIIYLDACTSFPLGCRMVGTVFRHSALEPLGVLITNFSKPDTGNPEILERNTRAIAAYLFPKRFWTRPNGNIVEGPQAYDYVLTSDDRLPENDQAKDPGRPQKVFVDTVRRRFGHYYGEFVTRSIMDVASVISPMSRLAESPLWKQLALREVAVVAERGKAMLAFGEEGEPLNGEAIGASDTTSLLWAFAACGAYGPLVEASAPPTEHGAFLKGWMRDLRGLPQAKIDAAGLVAAYHGLRIDRELQSDTLRRVTSYKYSQMAFLCDPPNAELGFYPAIAQIAHPMHCNVRKARRYHYVAKTNEMYLDVLPFDECRYVYDWLAAPALMIEDWSDESRQLAYRFALDGIAKSAHVYESDILHGCNVIGIDTEFPAHELPRRRKLT